MRKFFWSITRAVTFICLTSTRFSSFPTLKNALYGLLLILTLLFDSLFSNEVIFKFFQNFVTQSRMFKFPTKILTEKRGGIGHRVGPLTRGDSFSSALHNNGFKLITCDSFEKIYGYPTMFELIEDIQNAGESQCALNYRPLHKDMLMAAAGIYQAMYGDEYGIQGRDPCPIYGLSMISNLDIELL